MAYDPAAFPQDMGTGLQDTIDWNDAGGFAWLVHDPNATDYVVEGFDFSVNWSSEVLNISEGVAMIEVESAQTNDHTADDGPPEKQLQNVSFRVQRGPSGDRAINPGTNHVWVTFDPTTNDSVDFYINTTGAEPGDPFVKLGTLDTETETVERANPSPTATFNGVLVTPDN